MASSSGQGVQPDGVLAGGLAALGAQQGVADPLAAAAQVEGPFLEHDQAAAGAGHVAVVPAADQGLAVGQLLEEAAAGAKDPGHLAKDQLVLGVVLQVAEGVEQVEDGVEAGVGERQPTHVGLDQADPPALTGGHGGRPVQQGPTQVQPGDLEAELGQGDGVAALAAAQVEQARPRAQAEPLHHRVDLGRGALGGQHRREDPQVVAVEEVDVPGSLVQAPSPCRSAAGRPRRRPGHPSGTGEVKP
jgi:hypothetical protein